MNCTDFSANLYFKFLCNTMKIDKNILTKIPPKRLFTFALLSKVKKNYNSHQNKIQGNEEKTINNFGSNSNKLLIFNNC